MATGKLTPKQDKAIAALLAQPTIKQAAEHAGVGERTLHTWLDEPLFDAVYRAARRKAVQQATARLQQVSSAAVTVLLQLMASKETPPAVRLAAASKVLELSIKGIELEDLAARLAVLETLYAAQGP